MNICRFASRGNRLLVVAEVGKLAQAPPWQPDDGPTKSQPESSSRETNASSALPETASRYEAQFFFGALQLLVPPANRAPLQRRHGHTRPTTRRDRVRHRFTRHRRCRGRAAAEGSIRGGAGDLRLSSPVRTVALRTRKKTSSTGRDTSNLGAKHTALSWPASALFFDPSASNAALDRRTSNAVPRTVGEVHSVSIAAFDGSHRPRVDGRRTPKPSRKQPEAAVWVAARLRHDGEADGDAGSFAPDCFWSR